MSAQDPELSAALGWPGGISDPVLNRTRLLQMVAALRLTSKQALDALDAGVPISPKSILHDWFRAALAQQTEPVQDSGFWGRVSARQASRIKQLETAVQQALEACEQRLPLKGQAAIIDELNNLRAVLAQQAEPRNQCRSDGRCQYAIDHGAEGMGHCPKGKCVMAQHTQPAEDRAVAQSNLIVMKEMFREQAEPVAARAWVASKDGRVIYDDASTDDGLLRVSGDFENDEQRVRYAQRIVDKLNAAPPQRTMVPLTEEEIFKIENDIPDDVISDRAWTICLTRAVEKASWEKNHGQA